MLELSSLENICEIYENIELNIERINRMFQNINCRYSESFVYLLQILLNPEHENRESIQNIQNELNRFRNNEFIEINENIILI